MTLQVFLVVFLFVWKNMTEIAVGTVNKHSYTGSIALAGCAV